MILHLEPAPEAAQGAAKIYEVKGGARLPLRPLQGAVVLAPGRYTIAFDARAVRGDIVAPVFEAEGRVVPLLQDTAASWSGELVLDGVAATLALTPSQSDCSFVIAKLAVSDMRAEAAPPPSFGAAFALAARAAFRALPAPARAWAVQRAQRHGAIGRAAALRDREAGDATDAGRVVIGYTQQDLVMQMDFEERFAVARGVRAEGYVDPSALPPALPADIPAKLIAFHLPQFHAIPENDAWWGKGFTEWRNVAKAVPQFAGHAQPRLPGELDFYDLTKPGVLARQAELARAFGVAAFAFHYYWFAGKRLLQAPLDAFRADPSIDLGFCLSWANENWTRRWDGAEDDVLIGQRHSADDHARVFDDLASYADDPRYLRIDGRPLILVYRPDIIPDAVAMVDIWRTRAAARGWPGVFLAACNAFGFAEPQRLGFDALVQFPPHGLEPRRAEGLAWLNQDHRGEVYDYAAIAEAEAARLARVASGGAMFPGVMPGWDNEARAPGRGRIYHGATPALYERWLGAAVAYAQRALPADRRFVFVNAWNEWAEAAYLEPDQRWGRAYLAATARALTQPN